MTIIRIGEGRSTSGKILDRETTWFRLEEKAHAIKVAMDSHKKIFVSIGNRRYKEITLEQLKAL